MAPEKILLEGEDTEKAVDGGPHGSDPALPPRPGLRRDQINHRDTVTAQSLGQTQVEIGRIGEHGDVRPFRHDGPGQLAEFAPNARDVGSTSTSPTTASDRESTMDPNARRLHPRTGAAEKFGIRLPRAKRLHHARGVQIPRSFARPK